VLKPASVEDKRSGAPRCVKGIERCGSAGSSLVVGEVVEVWSVECGVSKSSSRRARLIISELSQALRLLLLRQYANQQPAATASLPHDLTLTALQLPPRHSLVIAFSLTLSLSLSRSRSLVILPPLLPRSFFLSFSLTLSFSHSLSSVAQSRHRRRGAVTVQMVERRWTCSEIHLLHTRLLHRPITITI